MSYKLIDDKKSPNFVSGRIEGRKKITEIVIHWWGDPAKNPSFEGVVNYFL